MVRISGMKCDNCGKDMERIDDGRVSGSQVWKCKCGNIKTLPVQRSRHTFNLNEPGDPLRGGMVK